MIRILPILFFAFSLLPHLTAQRTANGNNAYVDDQGVLRWSKNKEEIFAFGVNYTAPFAHAYKTAARDKISLEKAIDNDVYHFARLGFDAYRVHVWDCEISDSIGNLLDNDHLRLFDYTISKMKERGMKFVITPIAWWGNGWPEPDDKTPGFSSKYGKDACLTNPDAIKAQEKYLYQFLNHVNPYTGDALKNDPDIIAFEVCNEPHHQAAPDKVQEFIQQMVGSMRKTGCTKPIFYNVSHKIHLADTYFKSDIQGGTFQWYPTGLGSRHELQGNLLPNVDRYEIPFAQLPSFANMAKIVYEFDAADVGRSYIYPAMARSFREAGIQVATHFAYDPTFMAASNTEYGTHYMNLAYAPQKALSLKIASEVFHTIPRYKSFGRYPDNTSFDGFRISYEQDLAEAVLPHKFYYTNNTTTQPGDWARLEEIAGFGSSPVVQYEGRGAYFLDKVKKGIWRLEVMPDALWIRDPFEKTSPKKAVSAINYREWPMTITLPDLGEDFTITALNGGNSATVPVNGKTFKISPGTWLIKRIGATIQLRGNERVRNLVIGEFSAPAPSLDQVYVVHHPLTALNEGHALRVDAEIFAPDMPETVELVLGWGYSPHTIRMERQSGYLYSATIPASFIRKGSLQYFIAVKSLKTASKTEWHTFPSGVSGHPADWDFYDTAPWTIPVHTPSQPVCLFDASTDEAMIARQWIPGWGIFPTDLPGKSELIVNPAHLFFPDGENPAGEKHYDYSFRYYCRSKLTGRLPMAYAPQKIVVHGRAMNEKPCKIQIALELADGSAYGGVVTLGTVDADYVLSVSDLKPVRAVTLPRPYPSFLPYYFERLKPSNFSLDAIESIQFSIGPGIPENELQNRHGVAIRDVRLE